MVYGYGRISTVGQKDGNSLEAQESALRAEGAEQVFLDVISGAKAPAERPEMSKLLALMQEGDTLIVTKLDRISRTATEGFTFIQSLLDKNITVRVLNIGTMDQTATGKLIMHIFLAFSEFERDTIKARMMEGKAIAKQRPDYREGRPRLYSQSQLNHAMQLLEDYSYTQVAEMTGISKSTLAREARKRRATQ